MEQENFILEKLKTISKLEIALKEGLKQLKEERKYFEEWLKKLWMKENLTWLEIWVEYESQKEMNKALDRIEGMDVTVQHFSGK